MNTLDVTEIMNVLPHRYPMLLVDRITDFNQEEGTITGLKNLTFNEEFFQGHFPDHPVMPGVMQLEAMAQVAGIMLNSRDGNDGKVAYFMSIDNAKFRKPVVPGDQLVMKIETTRLRSRIASVKGRAFVDGEIVSEADLMFGYSS